MHPDSKTVIDTIQRDGGYAGADLRGHRLADASLAGVLAGVVLSGADLRDGQGRDADFSSSNLRGIDGGNVVLAGANLSRVDLAGARLVGADLSGANLFKTCLRGVNLQGANLDGARIHADLSGADLSGASLRGVAFSGLVSPGMRFDTNTVRRSGWTPEETQRLLDGSCVLDELPEEAWVALGDGWERAEDTDSLPF